MILEHKVADFWNMKTAFDHIRVFTQPWGVPGVNFPRKKKCLKNILNIHSSTQFLILIPNMICLSHKNWVMADKIEKCEQNFSPFLVILRKNNFSQEWKRISQKKPMRTFVLLQMAVRMAYDDRGKVSKPRRR